MSEKKHIRATGSVVCIDAQSEIALDSILFSEITHQKRRYKKMKKDGANLEGLSDLWNLIEHLKELRHEITAMPICSD